MLAADQGGTVTIANIAIYIALIVFIVIMRMIGLPVGPVKQQFILPVIIVVTGWGDAAKGLNKPAELTFTIVGCALFLGFGLLRGGADRLSARDGAPYVRWTWLSLGLFAANVVVKLGLDLGGIAAGETAKAAGHSLILTLGLSLLGQAAVIWYLAEPGGAALRTHLAQRSVRGHHGTVQENQDLSSERTVVSLTAPALDMLPRTTVIIAVPHPSEQGS
jgi:hypothetical protein